VTTGGRRPPSLRLATRGSALALAQTELAVAALSAVGVVSIETVVIRTRGDRDAHTPVAEMDSQGWFTGELEAALQQGRADVAVHSAKDLPDQLGAGLAVCAHLPRADCRDALVTRDGRTLEELPEGSTVGTGSPRRASLLAALRPGLRAVPIRGNVDTRLRKLDEGEVDALLLACAGLDRLGLGVRATQRLDPEALVPAPAQGALALEVLAGSEAAALCAAVDDAATTASVAAERSVLRALGGGCRLPLGAWGRLEGGRLRLLAALVVDGAVHRVDVDGEPDDYERIGALAAARLRRLAGAAAATVLR